MGLKEWGQGLELLTDYYYRYAKEHSKNERWFTTGAIIGEKKKSGGTYPVEIDLMAFLVDDNCKIKKIHSVQCKEAVNGTNEGELLKKFTINTVKELLGHAKKKGILSNVVSYVKITGHTKKKMERKKGLELLPFNDMVSDIIDMNTKYAKEGRKGYEREAIGWLVTSLYRSRQHALFSSEEAEGFEDLKHELEADGYKIPSTGRNTRISTAKKKKSRRGDGKTRQQRLDQAAKAVRTRKRNAAKRASAAKRKQN